MLKGQKGITLVALVVTIVVLIILAGVSMSLVLGDNGLIGRANQAKNMQANAEAHDQQQLNEADAYLANVLNSL